MIIFDLDGTLANCEHRRHFVDPYKHPDVIHGIPPSERTSDVMILRGYYKSTGEIYEPDWKSFYEACDKDEPIDANCDLYSHYFCNGDNVQIWSGRCESTREKTLDWLFDNVLTWGREEELRENVILKMRPFGDYTDDHELKEKWIDERLLKKPNKKRLYLESIDFVFDSDPRSVRMWKSRGVFVFNCNQDNGEF